MTIRVSRTLIAIYLDPFVRIFWRKWFLLLGGLNWILADVSAQTYTNLYGFSCTNGGLPLAGLVLSGNTLYGTGFSGGSGNGVLFKVNIDGTSYSIVYSFKAIVDNGSGYYTNTGGARPKAGLVLSGNRLYGTASVGGLEGPGTVFAVNTDGSGFTTLHNFTAGQYVSGHYTNYDGGEPLAGLILSGDTLYGTTYQGGNHSRGTVFAIKTNGSGFATLHNFSAIDVYANSDGGNPSAGLVLSSNKLYGTTSVGGSVGYGTVFAVNTDGTGFTNLHSFHGGEGNSPVAGLTLSGNILYGTTSAGGNYGNGVIFALDKTGSGFTNLHIFSGTSNSRNNDGVAPKAALVLSGNTLYGTATLGGVSGRGTIFAINTDHSNFTTLHPFDGSASDGALPLGSLILSSNFLYGTTANGNPFNCGSVFRLLAQPQMTILSIGSKVVLTWPTNATAFTLQSALTSAGTFTNIPGATSPYTNTIAGAQKYFRLISN